MGQILIDNEFITKRKDEKGRIYLWAGDFYLFPDANLTDISLIGIGKDTHLFVNEWPKFGKEKLLTNLHIKGLYDTNGGGNMKG